MASKPTIVPRLVIIEGKDKGKVIPLTDGTAVVGRTKGDVLVQDPRVSRSHIALHYDAKSQKLSFTDLKSLNGTVLNGKAAETGELKDGDKLLLGNTLFDCQIGVVEDEESSVHKVRDQLQREKAERDRSLSESSKAEPGVAVAEASDPNAHPDLEELHEEGEELKEPPAAARKHVRTERVDSKPVVTLSGIGVAYKKIPGRLRNLGLGVLLILGLLYYANLGRFPSTTSDNGFEMAAMPIRKLLAQGRVDDALARANELKTKYPTVADAHMLVGNILALQQKNDAAIEAYLKAKDLAPDDPLIHTNLVRLYIRSGQTEQAEGEMGVIDQMVKDGRHTKALFVEVAKLLLEFRKELKQPPEKALVLAKALQTELAPESAIGFKLEAQAHDQENRKPEALAAIEKGLLVEPNDTWLLEHSAILRLELKDIAGATTTVEKWIERHPASAKPLLIMGYLKFQGGDPNGAVRYLQQILQAAGNNLRIPEAREAVYLLGQIAWSQRSFKEALELYKQSCQAGYDAACNQEVALRKTLETTGDLPPGTDPKGNPPGPQNAPPAPPQPNPGG